MSKEETLGLTDSIVSAVDNLLKKNYYEINYNRVNTKLDKFRTSSIEYLKNALSDI